MRVSLNVPRESLEVLLEPEDDASPGVVQSLLREHRIPFETIRATGRWLIRAGFIAEVSKALAPLQPAWDTRSSERLTYVRSDAALRTVTDGFGSVLDHHLEHADDLGVRPYSEQREAARLMSAPGVRRFALFWKPGTGKTGAMITAAHELLMRGSIRGVLVVAERPQAVDTPWISELHRWLPVQQSGLHIAAVRGTKKSRLAILEMDPDWVIVHYDQLHNDQYALRSWAARHRAAEPPVVIFDESDLIKNAAARRSRAAMAIRQVCGRCWIASGTPAPNAPKDYKHQLSVLAGYPMYLPLTGDRERDAPIVVHELERGAFYLQRDNPRRMPEVVNPVRVDLSPPQRYEYDRLATDLLTDLRSMTDSDYAKDIGHVMERRLKLLRLCSDPGHDSLPSPVFDAPAKWPRLDVLLEEIMNDPDEKVVLWTRFRSTAVALHQRYRELYGASLMIGGSDGTPVDLQSPDCRLLIATMQKGSSSIDLTPARNAIYESLDDISRNYVQSMARINRTGQDRDCRYWILIARDTVDEDTFEQTMAKVHLSEGVMRDIGRPGRSEMINMLSRALGIDEETP